MYRQLALLEDLENECARYSALITQLKEMQQNQPAGSLANKNGYLYCNLRVHGKQYQISITDNETLIRQLKEKRYIFHALPILEKNRDCCRQALDTIKLYDPVRLAKELPPHYSDFDFSDLLLAGDINPAVWAAAPYPHNTNHPENLTHKSKCGLLTRSKSEAAIASELESRRLFFRYEPQLKLGRQIYCPDFCVVHPIHRRLIYWEHFGKMDDPQYVSDTMVKLSVYAEHGYHLGDNLIMTWETKKHPLHFGHIDHCLNTYFC